MRKRITLSLIFILLSVLIIGCVEVDPNDVVRIEFATIPKTTYVKNEEMEHFTLNVITVEGVDDFTVSSYDNFDDIGISGFDTSSTGTKTMYITYEGVTISVVYQVVANLEATFFAEGSGSGNSPEDPYLIETIEHFSNMRLFLNKHYKLIADIDLSGIDWDPIGQIMTIRTGLDTVMVNVIAPFSGSLDGTKTIVGDEVTEVYKFMGLETSTYGTRDWDNESGFGIFHAIQGTEGNLVKISNIDFTDVNVDIHTPATTLATYAEYVLVENVSVEGSISGRGVSGLIGNAYDSILRNVVNQVELTSGSTEYNAVGYRFIGGLLIQGSHVVFENCSNQADFYFPYDVAQTLYDLNDADDVTTNNSAFLIAGYFVGQGNNFYITGESNTGVIYGSGIGFTSNGTTPINPIFVGNRYTSVGVYEAYSSLENNWIGYREGLAGYATQNGTADSDWLADLLGA